MGKWLGLALISMAFLTVPGHSLAGQPLSIQIKPDIRPVGSYGNRLGLFVILKNGSGSSFPIMEPDNREAGESSYILSVQDPTGKQAQLTEYGQRIYGGDDIFVSGT